jgi:hypothetical protein
MKNLQEGDAARIPAYALKVTIDEPVDIFVPEQGNSVTTCTITQGPVGLAASCHADELPKPVYHPPGTYRWMGYDDHGRLGVGMRARWVTLRTKETNETYEEDRVFYVSPQGEVVDAGVSRTLSRFPPEDRGRCSWTYNQLHRVWWALGHGFSPHLVELQGNVVESGQRHELRVRGGFGDDNPVGVWRMGIEASPTRLVREATFLRDVDGQPLVEVTTKGERHLDGVTFAEEGSLRTSDGVETRVVLQDFQARFDDQLFAEVKQTLQNLEGEELQLVDYRSDPKNPTRGTVRLSAQREKDNK